MLLEGEEPGGVRFFLSAHGAVFCPPLARIPSRQSKNSHAWEFLLRPVPFLLVSDAVERRLPMFSSGVGRLG